MKRTGLNLTSYEFDSPLKKKASMALLMRDERESKWKENHLMIRGTSLLQNSGDHCDTQSPNEWKLDDTRPLQVCVLEKLVTVAHLLWDELCSKFKNACQVEAVPRRDFAVAVAYAGPIQCEAHFSSWRFLLFCPKSSGDDIATMNLIGFAWGRWQNDLSSDTILLNRKPSNDSFQSC